MKDRLCIEHARFLDVETHAEHVVDGVGIFIATEAVVGHPAAGCHAGRLARRELPRDPLDHARDLVGVRPRLLLGGHFPGIDPRHHLGPPLRGGVGGEAAVERVDPKLAFLHRRIVAANAVLPQKLLGTCFVRSPLGCSGREW